MRWKFKQDSPLGCAFGRDFFQIAGRRAGNAAGGELILHEGRLTPDAGGGAPDIDASSAAVKEAVHASGLARGKAFFSTRGPTAVLSVPNHLLIFKTIRVAPMPETELRSATHWKIAEEADLDPQESTSQIVTAWQVEESGKPKTEVLAVAIKNQDLQPYLDIAERAGLTVAAIDLPSSAICRSLGRTPAPSHGTPGHSDQLVLVLEDGFAALTVATEGQIRYMRILQTGLARLGQLVSQLTGGSPGESRPAGKSLATTTSEPAKEDLHTQAHSIFTRELSREISLAVRYYEETLGAGAPDRGVVIAAQGLPESASTSLSNLTSIHFQAAAAPPEALNVSSAGIPASRPGSTWHVPIGLCLYDPNDPRLLGNGTSAAREVQCA